MLKESNLKLFGVPVMLDDTLPQGTWYLLNTEYLESLKDTVKVIVTLKKRYEKKRLH